jgi:iron complex outermembrane receptor protein
MNRKKINAIELSIIACILSSQTSAQETSDSPESATQVQKLKGGLEDIIVTARRVEERLQSVPVSVTAVTSEGLRAQQIVQVSNLQRITPSFNVTKTQRGSSTPAIMIRGQRSFQSNTLSDSAVTAYFAEVGQSLAGGSNSSIFDLQSVEVLKGPQGTLFGRNTTGGAVLLTPKAPGDVFDGYAQASTGNYRYFDFEGMLNLPLTDTLAFRAAGKLTRRRGYMENPLRDARGENQHTDSARISLRWNPSDSFTTTTIGTYSNEDIINARKLFIFDVNRAGALATVIPQMQTALANVQSLGKYQYNDYAPEFSKTRIYSIQNTSSLDMDIGMDQFSVKNVFGYRKIKLLSAFDLAGAPVGTSFTRSGRVNADVSSNEFQLIGKIGNFDFIGGLYYYDQKALDTNLTEQFSIRAPLSPSNFPSFNFGDFDTHNRSYAAYFHGDFKLNALVEGLSVSGGIRITRDERGVVYHTRTATLNPNGPTRCTITGVTNPTSDRNLCAITAPKLTFSEPTYDASLNWQVDPNVLLYAAFRHGYRAGGFNNNPANFATILQIAYRPETVDDFEVGLKSDFHLGDMAGRLNVAVYTDSLTNTQRTVNVLIPATGLLSTVIRNASKGKIKGAEAELILNPTPALSLTFNGSIIDAGYKNFTDSYLVAGVQTPIDISDSKYAFVPKYQANFIARYNLPIPASAGDLSVQASYSYQSKLQSAEINTTNCGPDGLYAWCTSRAGATPGYGVVNMRIDWRNVAGAGFDLAVFANNLTNKFYYADAANAIGLFGLASASIGEPRMVGVELRVPFGASTH